MNEWISVKDRLPKSYESVLVYVPKTILLAPEIRVDWLEYQDYWHYSSNTVTHWMPLPNPPRMENEDAVDKCER